MLDQGVGYSEAESRCAALGAHLAVPRSEAENQCAVNLATTVWLGVWKAGGRLMAADGLAGPLPASETWWLPGEPNNDLGKFEDCIDIYAGGWNDEECSSRASRPLCQVENCHRSECP